MREIKTGNTTMRIRASALSALFYKSEFGGKDIVKAVSDTIGKYSAFIHTDINTMEPFEVMALLPDSGELYQILWALNKTQNVAEKLQTPNFPEWLERHQDDISIMEVFAPVMEESMRGFFRIENPNGFGAG